MNREEAENLLEDFDCINTDSGCTDSEWKRHKAAREKILPALCAEPAAPMSFEGFREALQDICDRTESTGGIVDEHNAQGLFERLNHFVDTDKMISNQGSSSPDLSFEEFIQSLYGAIDIAPQEVKTHVQKAGLLCYLEDEKPRLPILDMHFDAEPLRAIYDRMPHSADASKTGEGGVSFEFWTQLQTCTQDARFFTASLAPLKGMHIKHFRAVEVKP